MVTVKDLMEQLQNTDPDSEVVGAFFATPDWAWELTLDNESAVIPNGNKIFLYLKL